MRPSLLLSLVLWCGCASSPPTLPTESSPQEPDTAASAAASTGAANGRSAQSSATFGGERYGFVEAWSANGRFVALRRFAGDEPPRFSHHGSASGGAPLVVIDRETHEERPAHEIVDVTPDRRRWLLQDASGITLLDTETGSASPLGAAEDDENRCLPPRQAAFSPRGARVAWIAGDARSATIRDLASGTQWTLASESKLWRIWPDDEGRGATVLEIPSDSASWPEQHTSCACRWCNRFAASYGFYGWGGPAFTIAHVDDAGARATLEEPPEMERSWTGPTDEGCVVEPESEEEALEHGPWRLTCPR